MSMKTTNYIALASLLSLTACHGFYNLNGAHQRKAEKEARAWADGAEMPDASITCKKKDSDGDGDVTCTVAANGERVTVECPTRKFFRFAEDSGCKETRRISGKLY